MQIKKSFTTTISSVGDNFHCLTSLLTNHLLAANNLANEKQLLNFVK